MFHPPFRNHDGIFTHHAAKAKATPDHEDSKDTREKCGHFFFARENGPIVYPSERETVGVCSPRQKVTTGTYVR